MNKLIEQCLWLSGLIALGLYIHHSAANAKSNINQESGKLKATPAPKPELKTSKSPSIEMVDISGGSFLMGSTSDEVGHESNEESLHSVTVSSFAIGKYEITQAQWRTVMGNNPSTFKGDELPVGNVSWIDANEFCRKLSKMTGKKYRLPSEAEWEYAARGNTTGPYPDELGEIAWYSDNAEGTAHPVGQKRPNAFGLYDMHGNVREWCEDTRHSFGYYGAPADGSSWVDVEKNGFDFRIVRGGAWYSSATDCRSASRASDWSRKAQSGNGFRVVISSSRATAKP
jgi:eukaryotic-like serine/threonine-protein kinase